MDQSKPTVAQQVAFAASAFQQERTGHLPKSVTVVLSGETFGRIRFDVLFDIAKSDDAAAVCV